MKLPIPIPNHGFFFQVSNAVLNIFVLIPSLKTTESPYKKLENYLTKQNIPCMTPISDEAKLDEDVINNKILIKAIKIK